MEGVDRNLHFFEVPNFNLCFIKNSLFVISDETATKGPEQISVNSQEAVTQALF